MTESSGMILAQVPLILRASSVATRTPRIRSPVDASVISVYWGGVDHGDGRVERSDGEMTT